MLFLPKNDGEFEAAIRKFKQEYIGKAGDCADEEAFFRALSAKYGESYPKLDKLLKSKTGRRKLKREFCRMENRRIELELEGEFDEANELKEKFAWRKHLYEEKNTETEKKV